MAAPTQAELSTIFYHGTSKKKYGEEILKTREIKPREIEPDLSEQFLTPLEGRIYFSSALEQVIPYVLGGDLAETDYFEPGKYGDKANSIEPYGYLFSLDSSKLTDVLLDEDSIGELIYEFLNNKLKTPLLKNDELAFLKWLVSGIGQFRLNKVKDGEYDYWASVGKQILRKIRNDKISQRRLLSIAYKCPISLNLSNAGMVSTTHAWKFPKIKTKELKTDGSNFFELSIKIY